MFAAFKGKCLHCGHDHDENTGATSPAPVTTDDEWAQLASDCGVSPACESRAEFVALMRQVVEQSARATEGDGWIACSERMPDGYDNWVLAWHPKWPRVRLVNWCNARVDSGHWRNEADDICYFEPKPTHWKFPTPPPTDKALGEG